MKVNEKLNPVGIFVLPLEEFDWNIRHDFFSFGISFFLLKSVDYTMISSSEKLLLTLTFKHFDCQRGRKWLQIFSRNFFSSTLFLTNSVQTHKKKTFFCLISNQSVYLASSQLICWRCDPCPNPHDNSSAFVTAVTCTSSQASCVVRLMSKTLK